MLRFAAVFMMFLASPAIATEVYKCKGADGSTVFAPKPCGSDAVPVALRPAPTPDPAAAPPSSVASPSTAPAAIDDREDDRRAREYADSTMVSCLAPLDDLANRISEIERTNMKMEPYSMFASDDELEARRQSALRPLYAQQNQIQADCDERWRENYNAARFH